LSKPTLPNLLENKLLLTRDEVAALLRVCQRSADALIRRGALRTVRIGGPNRGRVLIPRSELLKLIEGENSTKG
jgi:excisionase family DNA binding protein